jgi:tRNA/tmRNA/rRNA uracil-C5-methylase (TrmA/RlmC/RlmD family)
MTRQVQVRDQVELSIGEAAHGGWCVARIGDGGADAMVVFVRHALPGERVRAVITQVTAKFARADATQVLVPSPDRVSPPCPAARPGGCGGCDWQHASLAAQRALKASVLSQQLQRIAGLSREVVVEPVPGDQEGLGWRTRVKFAVGRNGMAGLHRHRSHDLVPITDCLIAHPLVSQAEVTRERWPGADAVDVATAPASGMRTVTISGPRRPDRRQGPRSLTQHAAGRDWRVSATGFWQVHPGAADVLADAMLAWLAPEPGDVALDLFCGAGLFAGVLADVVGPEGTVIGVEHDQDAVRDARANLRPTPWARVHRGDAAEVIGRIGTGGARIAVLDPPRTGLDRALIELLAAAPGLARICYISCDPATFARDLAGFGQHGWQLAELRAFDAFPMTHHIEAVALLLPAPPDQVPPG